MRRPSLKKVLLREGPEVYSKKARSIKSALAATKEVQSHLSDAMMVGLREDPELDLRDIIMDADELEEFIVAYLDAFMRKVDMAGR